MRDMPTHRGTPSSATDSVCSWIVVEKGFAREVAALMGERAPPTAIMQVQPKYKQRPKRQTRAKHWYAKRAM